ncbi:mitochondrial 39S ribosomal protein L3 [Sergentomyia squamirostris]
MLGWRKVNCLNILRDQFTRLTVCEPNLTRGHRYENHPRKRNPFWFVRQHRVQHEDLTTRDNQEFIREVVNDQYGPPSLIKGVTTYPNAVSGGLPAEQVNTEWNSKMRRTGVIAKKIGDYPLWLKNGKRIRTTLLQIADNHVIKYIPPEKFEPMQKPKCTKNLHKFGCLMVGAESMDPTMLTKEYCGLFKDSGVMPKAKLARFIISPEAQLLPGTPLNVSHFKVGDYVDVYGKTIFRGFHGVMKRWGFHGQPASHGQTKTHRRPGNIGGGGEKGRVWPGKKMPGHMGNRYRISKGLKIWRINTKYNVMWVQGSSIPGETNNFVYIFDSYLPLCRKTISPPFPTHFESNADNFPEDIYHEDVHSFQDPTILYEPET